MGTAHNERNAPGAESRGASNAQALQVGCSNESTPTPPDLQALETLAEWRESLDARFNRARLQYGLVGMSPAELRRLYKEGQAWKRICSALLHDGEAA